MKNQTARTCGQKDTDGRNLAADRALLSTAVEQAGETARRFFRGDVKPRYKGPGQIVTEADLAIDQQLHDCLIGGRPEDGWLSEERNDDGSRHQRRYVWVVDPIDGTRSFAEGVGEFTISAALLFDGRPVLASVLNPLTSECFEAAAGCGATLNGNALIPSEQTAIAGASILASSGEMKKRRWPDMFPEASFTTIGSLAYKLALVAAGRFDGLVSLRSCSDWDIAAAVLLLEEAGARLSDGQGLPVRLNQSTVRHHGLVAAGSDPLYNACLSRLEMVASSSL